MAGIGLIVEGCSVREECTSNMAAQSQPDKRRNCKRILFSFNVDVDSPFGVGVPISDAQSPTTQSHGEGKGDGGDDGVLTFVCLSEEGGYQ